MDKHSCQYPVDFDENLEPIWCGLPAPLKVDWCIPGVWYCAYHFDIQEAPWQNRN